MSDLITVTITEDVINATVDKVVIIDGDIGGNTQWGAITGTLTNQTDLVDALDQKLFRDSKKVYVRKNPGAYEYGSIKDAVDAINDASVTNIYVVEVGSGTFTEDTITMKPYVFIVGAAQGSVIVANGANKDLIVAAPRTGIVNCSLSGVSGTGYALVKYVPGVGTTTQTAVFFMDTCGFYSTTGGANLAIVDGTDSYANMQVHNCVWGGSIPFAKGFYVTGGGNSGVGARLMIRESITNGGKMTGTVPAYFAYADGLKAQLDLADVRAQTGLTPANTAIIVNGGAVANISGCTISGWDVGISATDSLGNGSDLKITVPILYDNNTDIDIEELATGYYSGHTVFLKTVIAEGSDFHVLDKDRRIITVAKQGGDFDSISAACDAITAAVNIPPASVTSPYTISVGAGVFTEPEIVIPQYVSIVGAGINATCVYPDGNHHVFTMDTMTDVSFLNVNDAPAGYAAFNCTDVGNFAQLHKISIYNCYIGIKAQSNTKDSTVYAEYVDVNSQFERGISCVSQAGFAQTVQAENFYTYESVGNAKHIFVSGSDAVVDCTAIGLRGDNTDTGVYAEDGGTFLGLAAFFTGFDKAVRAANFGAAPTIRAAGSNFTNNTLDVSVEHPSTVGSLVGAATHDKIQRASPYFVYSMLDVSDGEYDITSNIAVNFPDGTHTDLSTLVFEGAAMGVFEGGTLSVSAGLTLAVAEGSGYVDNPLDNGVVKRLTWADDTILLPANSERYIYYTYDGILSAAAAIPSVEFDIILGRVVTNGSTIELIDMSPMWGHHTANKTSFALRDAFGSIYKSGSIASEGGTGFTLNVTSGKYYFGDNEFLPSGGSPITFAQYYHNNDPAWSKVSTSTVNNTQYNNGNTLASLTAGYYTKHALYVSGDGTNEKYFLVLGQAQYSTLPLAQAGNLPTPPNWFKDSVALIALVYVQEGATNISEIELAHPTLSYRSASTAAGSDHGNLTGLSDDDHQQYLLVTGSRAMSGGLNMGGNQITNVGNVDGVDVSAHASRHSFGGADGFTKGTPAELTDSTNVQGTDNVEFAAGNHTHAHGNRGGGTLHAAATTSVDGFMSAADKTKLDAISGTNTGNVTLAGTLDYITLSGQVLTLGSIDLATDITGNLAVSHLNSGTGASNTTFWRGDGAWATPVATLADGDYGDITVSGSGTVFSIDANTIGDTEVSALSATKITTDSTHRFITDTQLSNLGNQSGTNTGDQNLFSTIAVSGQSNVVADAVSDTLTLAAGTGVTITTVAGTDTITFTGSPMLVVRKTADEVRSANTTLTADTDLQVALTAGTYTIRGKAYLNTANATMDYKYDFNYTGTVTSLYMSRRHLSPGTTTGAPVNTHSSTTTIPSTAVTANTAGYGYVEFECTITVSTSGTFQFRWAQNTSDAGSITVLRGSSIEYMAS